MKRVLVLGIGNRLMGDDGIGNEVVELLREYPEMDDYELVAGETDVDFCLRKAAKYETIVIIDAMMTSRPFGEVDAYPLEYVVPNQAHGLSVHGYSSLNGLADKYDKINGWLIGIEPFHIHWGYGLTQELQCVLPKIAEKTAALILQTIKKKNAKECIPSKS